MEMRNVRLRLHPRSESYLHTTHRFQGSNVPKNQNNAPEANVPDEGAMSRRLSEMTESALETGGMSASIRSEYPSAFAEVEAPSAARKDARAIAGARRWSGMETVEESSRRMLESSHRGAPTLARSLPITGQMPEVSPGTRIKNAIDQTATYAHRESGMSAEEKEQFLKEQRERFLPGARDIPSTLSGLASLANERIEEAIARGQFKNLPRGKPQEVDHNSSSPFMDTTEYLMNRMIKNQDCVPPWIAKQQELATAVRRFRARLRSDWKRHAARVIASHGGSLLQQIRRAEAFAAAELTSKSNASQEQSSDQMTPISPVNRDSVGPLEREPLTSNPNQTGVVFRDPAWEATERAFHQLSIKSLNSQTRSYNLMAPRTAQRPCYSLQRELKSCYADVAPLVGEEICARAASSKRTTMVESVVHGKSALAALGVSEFRWKDVWRDMWTAKSS